MRRLIPGVAVLVGVAFAAPAQGQQNPAGPGPKSGSEPSAAPGSASSLSSKKTPDGPAEFEARFADDSTVRLSVLDPTVSVVTKYGKLSIPLADVRKVDLGFRYPDGVEAKVEEALDALGSPNFRSREEAERALVGIGEFAVPGVRRALKSTDPEVVRRAEAVMKKLKDKLPEEKLEQHDQDVVVTDEFTVRGRLEGAGLKTRTRYFGEVVMRLNEVRALRSIAGGVGEGKVTLEADKYAKQGWANWMDTGIDVSGSAPLEITATGQIDQWAQTPGQYVSGPQGTQSQAPGVPQGKPVTGIPAGPGGQFVRSGSVIGRIGADGAPFYVGGSYKASKAPATGRLYLIVAPSNWGNDSVGSYEMKIKSGE